MREILMPFRLDRKSPSQQHIIRYQPFEQSLKEPFQQLITFLSISRWMLDFVFLTC
jgi:hypothetical protein